MNPQEALALLDGVVKQVAMNRQQHLDCAQAFQLISSEFQVAVLLREKIAKLEKELAEMKDKK